MSNPYYTFPVGEEKADGETITAAYFNGQFDEIETGFDGVYTAVIDLTDSSDVRLESFGAAGDGVTDDAADIQAAIDSGAPIIRGSNKTYKVNSKLTLRSNLVLKDMTLDFSSLTALDGSFRICVKAAGSGIVDSSVLASNAVAKTYSVTVSTGEGSKFAAGDYVLLASEDLYNYPSASVKRGEIKQVQAVVGDVVSFREAIYEGYTTANTAKLNKLSMLSNIVLDNVKIIGTNTENNANVGFSANYVNGLVVRNGSFKDIDLYELALYNVVNFDVAANQYDGVRYTGTGTAFYGIALFNCTQWGTVRANRGEELRHLVVTSSSGSYYGQPYFIAICHNVMRNAMAGDGYASWAYENHGFGRFITWANNLADSCHTGINLEKGDQVVVGNILKNCRISGINIDTEGREMQNILIANNLIGTVTQESPSGLLFGISLLTSASQVRENILITGNILHGFSFSGRSDFGLRIYPASGNAKGCVISNNIIQNDGAYESTDYGLYLEQGGWIVRGNTFKDYERAIALVASAADNTTIQGNDFSVTSIASTQAQISAAANNCIIVHNIFRNVYRSIANTGTGNIIHGNSEIAATSPVTDAGTSSVWAETTVPRRGSVTIASGSATLPKALASVGIVQLDTEAAAASDDLDTITAGYDGQVIVLKTANSARDVVVKDGTGNLKTNGDFTLSHTDDRMMLICDGTSWFELSRSDNNT